MPYQPTLLQVPPGHTILEVSSFTPQGSLLGTALEVQSGVQYTTVCRWSPSGVVETLANRMRNVYGRVVGGEDGVVVLSAAYDHDGPSKPLAIVAGQVHDLGAAYPGPTGIARMNASGSFVGIVRGATHNFGFVATLTAMRPVVTPDPSAESNASGITDDGLIYGNWRPGPGVPMRGFLERGGVAEDLREFLPVAANESWLAVGRLSTGSEFAYGTFDLRQRPLEYRPVPLPRGQEYMSGALIDGAGNVAGYCWQGSPAATPYEGFVASGGGSERLDVLLGLSGQGIGRITAIGRDGAIAGPFGASHYVARPGAAPVVAAPVKKPPRPLPRR